ncbi:helix-turn-helix transcriptional regulator [Raoultibacter phocaeensis]|uniref:helix-turn-helix transcriptional regulator n=1 Tax=Raoultibacter phocaeensis TaxID=2479841 RepID=UPI00111AEF66|nr:helix-turn-helix transcriptional regulator [Raoultibacter phocaeensis]
MGEFACNLKKYRQLAGLSQDELAARVGVRRETINRLEACRYNPSLKLAVDISRTVHAPIEALFEFPEP